MLKKYDIFKQLALNEIAAATGVDLKANNAIRRSFMQIQLNLGFFAELIFNLNIIEAHPSAGITTMATDGKSIAYWPDFVNKLSEQEVSFVMIHEIMHNANFHFARQAARDHHIWNCACDYAINLQIKDLANEMPTKILAVPKEILLDEKYRGMNAEQIYDILEKDPSQLPPPPKGGGGSGQGQPGQGQPGQGPPQQGQGAGSQTGQGRQAPNGGLPEGDIRKPGSLDGCGTKVYEGSKAVNEAEGAKDLEEAWRKIRDDAATRNQGTGSDSFDRWVRKLNKPKINWRVELRKFVKNVFDELDFGYSNKRFIWQDKHLPTAKEIDTSSYQNVVIAIDTSGSIGDETLGKFATEMMKLFKDYAIQEVTVIWCDSEIPRGGIQQFAVADKNFDLKKLKPVGGGGTSFKPPFMWVEQYLIKKHKTPAFMIYFTDACGDAPLPTQFRIREYHDRVMWVITETESAPHIKFGKKIFIDKLAN